MKAVILAAGRGQRLGNLTKDRPKCLVEVAGATLLDHQIAALRMAGLAEIGVVRGYRGGQLERFPVTLIENPRWADSNMCASLMAAKGWLEDDDAIVSYADIVYSANAVRTLLEQPGEVVILYDPNWWPLWRRRMADPLDDAESFRLSIDGSVEDIGRRPVQAVEIQGQYMGLIKLTRAGLSALGDVLARIPAEARAKTDMTSLLRLAALDGVRIGAVPTPDPWMEIDTTSDLALCEAMVGAGELRPEGRARTNRCANPVRANA